MNPKIKKAVELAEKIRDLQTKQDETLVQLTRSLMLKDLWPDAFAKGSCKSLVKGNPNDCYTMILTNGLGEQKEFDIRDVPVELWPETLKKDLVESGKRGRRPIPAFKKKAPPKGSDDS